jgi:hypothetical protein
MAIWAFLLHLLGIGVFIRRPEDRASRRERIKKMGKLRYILLFGVFGYGLALAVGITSAGLLAGETHGWVFAVGKLLLLAVIAGWFQGAWTWKQTFRDPVPFPPNYLPPK